MSQTVGAVLIVAIGVMLVAFSVTMLTGFGGDTAGPARAATDVETGPSGVTVELQAVDRADAIAIKRNGEVVKRITSPTAGTTAVVNASQLSPGDELTVVGENDGQEFVLDSYSVGNLDFDVGSLPAPSGDTGPSYAGDSGQWQPGGDGRYGQVASGGDDGVYAGGDDGTVTRLGDGENATNWTASVGDAPITELTGEDGGAVVGTADETVARVTALGTVAWRVDPTADVAAVENATVADVAVGADGTTYAAVQSAHGAGYAIATVASNGTVTSTVESADALERVAVAADGRTYAVSTAPGTDDRRLQEIAANGTVTATRTLARPVSALAAAGDRVVYGLGPTPSRDGTVVGLAADGTVAWRYDVAGNLSASALAVNGSRTVVGLAADGAIGVDNVIGLDATGTETWTQQLSVTRAGVQCGLTIEGLTVENGTVYAASDGRVFRLDAT
ncbi:MAG: hypothetical protein ABEJ31_06580 [Haloarculaceae archaeon]